MSDEEHRDEGRDSTLALRDAPVSPASLGRLELRLERAGMAAVQPTSYLMLLLGAAICSLLGMTGMASAAPLFFFALVLTFLGRVTLAAFSPTFAARIFAYPGPPFEPSVLPAEIESEGLRLLYGRVVDAHEHLRVVLSDEERLGHELDLLYDGCGEVVEAAGRTAARADDAYRFVREVHPDVASRDRARLLERAMTVHDEGARRTLRAAAEARAHEIETLRELRGVVERAMARLELAMACMESIRATAIKARAMSGEQLDLARGQLEEQLDLLWEHERIEALASCNAV